MKDIEPFEKTQPLGKTEIGLRECPHCGASVDAIDNFCTDCGGELTGKMRSPEILEATTDLRTKVAQKEVGVIEKQKLPGPNEVLCPGCGAINPLARFCDQCSTPLPQKEE